VLAGGGAKGAWQVGVLKGLCEDEKYRNAWDVLSGTSIGALNAGLLAQFEQSRQCSEAIEGLESYWRKIRSTSDIWKTTHVPGRIDMFGREDCLSPKNLLAAGYGFFKYGGFCDPSPGAERYRKAVNVSKIRDSGMRLRVVAASLATGTPTVFTESDPDVLDACMASGSIAPIVYPKHMRGEVFVDGGIFHNTPLLATLQQSVERKVKRAVVILLGPLTAPPAFGKISGVEGNLTDRSGRKITGLEILEYYLEAITSNLFDTRELRDACMYFPEVSIEAVIPKGDIGSVVDFAPSKIEAMMEAGRSFVREGHGPVDACALLGVARYSWWQRPFAAAGRMMASAGSAALVPWQAPSRPSGGGVSLVGALLVGFAGFFLGRSTAPQSRVCRGGFRVVQTHSQES